MFLSMIKNDIKKNKVISIVLIMFVTLSSMLVSSGVNVFVNLFGAIDEIMEKAETPHFMQMHSGSINSERLNNFVNTNDLIDEYQTLTSLNIDSSKIIINGESLNEKVQDNAFVVQSPKFDYLLDLNNEIIVPSVGEIYVPIYYMEKENISVGDVIIIKCDEFSMNFNVAGFLRDSQMNSSIASSKRFLINESDYKKLSGNVGEFEYLIEFRLKDEGKCGEFETAYINAELEANGPTITYELFKLINGMTDGLMAAIMILISILIVFISFLCIRFTLSATIEEDYREIGIMKALGMKNEEIERLYLGKYKIISIFGCIAGYILSFPINNILLKNMRLYMGGSDKTLIGIILSVLGSMIVCLISVAYVKIRLKQMRKISAVTAIRVGNQVNASENLGKLKIAENEIFNTNVLLGIKDVLARKKQYTVLLSIFILASFIIIVPINLFTTLTSDDVVKYLGIGKYHMRVDVQQVENIDQKSKEIYSEIQKDKDILNSAFFVTASYKSVCDDGTYGNIKIESGNQSAFPLEYLEGKEPKNDDEIALSIINAKEFNKKVGDSLTIIKNDREVTLKVCGIYQDVTNGGKTAKATFEADEDNVMWYIICCNFKDGININDKVNLYSGEFPYAKVGSISEYSNQTLSGIIKSLKMVVCVGIILAVSISVLIVMLFMKMIIVKDSYGIATMKAVGFTSNDIYIQYITRSIFIMIVGIMLGTIISNTLGVKLCELSLSSLGIANLKFVIDPIIAYVIMPILLTVSVILATIISIKDIKKMRIIEYLKDE